MLKANKKYLLLFLIFTFAFIYRMLLMHWATFPPGADIGLHNSVIYSITPHGNANFLWNFYQIGGGLSLTFPGYHIFASYVMMMTGMPDYLVHSLIVSLFSSLIVLCAFLITRSVWRESAAFIVAFLVAISRFDIEMLLWGGYPNVITLLLIPLAFYLFLQRERFSLLPFIVATSILSGTIFLTHSLSAGIYVSIIVVAVLFVLVSPKTFGTSRKHVLYWLFPIFLGVIIVSPFLVKVLPAYLVTNSDALTGEAVDIRQALLSTRVLPLELVLPLFACLVLFPLLSKKYNGRFFSLPAFLLAVWLLVPLLFTQGYLVGFYIDYNRFLYFTILPVMIIIGMVIDHGSGFFARIIDTYRSLTSQLEKTKKTVNKIGTHLNRKNIYSIFVIGFLLFAFFAVPIFITPAQGVTVQSFYQVMTGSGYEAIQWAKQNTPVGSIFVSDALYGWWFSGFAQRPTLSAVDPQYLTLAREFEPAKFAKNLLDTDYIIDNGLIQVREDGGYIGRHNPMFLAKLNWTYFPYPFLHFNNSKTAILFRVNNNLQSLDLDKLPVKEMRIENDTDHATIVVKKGNEFFNYTQLTTVYRGTPFVNMSITVDSTVEGVSLDWLDFFVNSKGRVTSSPQNNTIGLLDEGVKALSQIIFTKEQPSAAAVLNEENPCILKLQYNLQGKSKGEIQLSVGVISVTNDQAVYQDQERKNSDINSILAGNLNSPLGPKSGPDLDIFDYRQGMKDRGVSYIICRGSDIQSKFANDPAFSLVFINKEVAIFKVKGNLNQDG